MSRTPTTTAVKTDIYWDYDDIVLFVIPIALLEGSLKIAAHAHVLHVSSLATPPLFLQMIVSSFLMVALYLILKLLSQACSERSGLELAKHSIPDDRITHRFLARCSRLCCYGCSTPDCASDSPCEPSVSRHHAWSDFGGVSFSRLPASCCQPNDGISTRGDHDSTPLRSVSPTPEHGALAMVHLYRSRLRLGQSQI